MATRAPRKIPEALHNPALDGATGTDETWPVQIMRKADGSLGVTIEGSKPLDQIESEETAADRVAIAIADVTGDARAYVRIAKLERGKYAWCTDYTPQQYEDGGLSMLREEWGAGEYDIRLYATNPNGLFNVRAKTSIVLVGVRNAQQFNHAPPVDPVMKATLEAILATQQSIAQALAQKPAVDPMAQFQQFLVVMGSMRGVLGVDAQSAPKAVSLAEQIREAREISSLLGDGSDSDNMMTQLAPIVDLVKTAMSKDNGPNIPIITMPEGIRVNPQSIPAQTIMPVTNSAPENQSPSFAYTMKQFIHMAEINSKPADAASFLVSYLNENLQQEYVDQIANLLDSDDWWTSLKEITPGIAPYETWATLARAELLLLLFDADEPVEIAAESGSLVNPV